MKQSYRQLSSAELERVEGGFPWGPIVKYIAVEIVNEAISETTQSCRKNPRQWFCVKVG